MVEFRKSGVLILIASSVYLAQQMVMYIGLVFINDFSLIEDENIAKNIAFIISLVIAVIILLLTNRYFLISFCNNNILQTKILTNRNIVYWIASVVLLVILFEFFSYLFSLPHIPNNSDLSRRVVHNPLWWFIAIILAPYFEELLFRGLLLSAFTNIFGLNVALILSSGLWALSHTHLEIIFQIQIFIFGLLLGYSKHKEKSIFVPYVMHSAHNIIIIILTITFF